MIIICPLLNCMQTVAHDQKHDTIFFLLFFFLFLRTESSNLPQWHNESTWPLGVGTGCGGGISGACPSHSLLTREPPSCGH